MRLRPDIVRQQIDNLLVTYPELREDETLRLDMIEGETEAFEFLAMIVQLIEDTKALVEGAEARIAELRERVARFGRREEGLRALAFKIMSAADLRKAELPCATLSIRAGTPKVIVTDEAIIPDLLCTFERKVNKAKIKEMLAGGAEVRGAVMSNGESSLSIRVK